MEQTSKRPQPTPITITEERLDEMWKPTKWLLFASVVVGCLAGFAAGLLAGALF